MNNREKMIIWAAIAFTLLATAYGVVRTRSIRSLTGAVLREDPNPGKQLTIPNAEINVSDDSADGAAKSDSAGYFHVNLRRAVRKGETLTLHLRHPDYHPLDLKAPASDHLFVIRMIPASTVPVQAGAQVVIGDVHLRYGVNRRTTENVGSVAKVFEVPNTGDVPCTSKGPCSPDGKWKAAIGGASLDAGADSEFRDARVSCIAGPCPFTKIEKDSFSRGGRQISVLIRNWSDATTFVLEAEVMHTMSSDLILQSYPTIFNGTASFTLPAKAQGPSIEATVDHQEIVYPLGPAAKLSWADCDVQTGKDLTRLYRCVLKPGYQFQ
jgi:hypothetical protein